MSVARLKTPVERAAPHTARLHVRSLDPQADVAHFTGYASTANVPYAVRDWLGEYTETILPGAFAKTLREKGAPGGKAGVPLLLNHNQDLVLAHTSSGTSVLEEDARGLKNDAQLDMRQSLGRDTAFQLERGDLNKMSFSFRAIKDTWNADYTDRRVQESELFDTSIVLNPANSTTTADLREMMRSALGREGRSLWLSDTDKSVRSSLPMILSRRSSLDAEQETLLEQALRALEAADSAVATRADQARARTFRVAQAMLELRQGKTLSSANKALLQQAASALSAADKHHQQLADHHASAAGKIQSVLDASSDESSNSGTQGAQDGKSHGTPPGNGNPISPPDGAGPRSLQLKRRREAEVQRLRDARWKRERSERLRRERAIEIARLRRDIGQAAPPAASRSLAELALARQMRAQLYAESQIGGKR